MSETASSSPAHAFRVQGLVLRRNGRTLLDGVTWSLPHRRHAALLGANGSGKTTLLKVILGYEWPTDGTVEVLGNTYGECVIAEVRKRIGIVSAALEPRIDPKVEAIDVVLSGIEATIGLFRDFTGEEVGRAQAALADVGGASIAEKPWEWLSEGERQRSLIARALVGNPDLLVLDEPCAGLDPASREHLLVDLARLASREDGPTLLLVTHHIEEIAPWISEALLLSGGRPLAGGPGPVDSILTSKHLSEMLGRTCKVHREGPRRYLLFPEN